MPNIDGGHYFLTALAPVDNRGIVEHEGMKSSPIHMVREALETLPTALQSHATERTGIQSPFARSPRTHFARLVVLDDPFYNGRDPTGAIGNVVGGVDLMKPQPVDSLACPYLLVMIDFDPAGADEPEHYLASLWDAMQPELRAVFQYCYGFDAVADRATFAHFVMACQIETTMSFNDYRVGAPPLPSLSLWQVALPPLLALGLGVAVVAMAQTGFWFGALIVLALLALALFVDYRIVLGIGARPFPPAPDNTLPDVLKALYLQQAFTRFAAAHQGDAPAALQAAFRSFVAQAKPEDRAGPTQRPGVIRTPASELPHA